MGKRKCARSIRLNDRTYTICGHCAACRNGRPNACRYNQTLGVQRDGALTEYISIPWTKIISSASLNQEELALTEPLTVGFHTVDRGRVSDNDTVMVLGCGMIGAGAVVRSAQRGANVFAVDIDDAKLDLAKRLGAQVTINSRDSDLSARLDEMTGGDGPAVVIEAAGNPVTTRIALEEAAFTGRIILIGYVKDDVLLQTPLVSSAFLFKVFSEVFNKPILIFKTMKRILTTIMLAVTFTLSHAGRIDKTKVLIVDGYSNHDWEYTTLFLKSLLLHAGFCSVDVTTAPLNNSQDFDAWNRDFSKYDVVIQNCNSLGNGNYWPGKVQRRFEEYMLGGGGMVVFHSANNSFPEWKEYNRMIGLGWRKAEEGYAVQIKDGKIVKIPPGSGDRTNHGARQDLEVQKLTDHPINHGFPDQWKTPDCELYRFARGPAENMQVLSYARDGKTGIDWPVDWVVRYGKGRIYNATYGHIWHDQRMPPGIQCVGFQTSLLRAVQWTAHKKVTWKVPENFPDKDHISLHPIKMEYLPGDGWETLFNGKDLHGWEVKCAPADEGKTYWQVRDGAIECNSTGRDGHDYVWLMNKEELANFHLILQFQVFRSSPGNSGVQFRSRYQDPGPETDRGWLSGPQVDIHPPAPFRTGLIYDETKGVQRWICPSMKNAAITKSDAPEEARETKLVCADDDPDAWNTLELICRGTHVITFVNGRKISDFDGSGILDDQAHQKYGAGMTGRIALQLHRGDELKIRFKDLKVKIYQ